MAGRPVDSIVILEWYKGNKLNKTTYDIIRAIAVINASLVQPGVGYAASYL